DVLVPNNAYSGPSASAPPYNQKTITRHYGFGSTTGTVTVGNVPITITNWSDTSISGTVNLSTPPGPNQVSIPQCAIQQQPLFGGPTGSGASPFALCGQLIITTSTGVASIDSVTVTVGGKAPTHIAATDSIQTAIDKAAPGDLLIVDPTCTAAGAAAACSAPAVGAGTQIATNAAHTELVLMWKPVRLQGVGAPSSIINANTHPAGKLNDWRARVDCLFGLGPDGDP